MEIYPDRPTAVTDKSRGINFIFSNITSQYPYIIILNLMVIARRSYRRISQFVLYISPNLCYYPVMMTPENSNVPVSLRDAAAAANIPAKVLRAAIRRGELARARLGGRYYVRPADVASWVSAHLTFASGCDRPAPGAAPLHEYALVDPRDPANAAPYVGRTRGILEWRLRTHLAHARRVGNGEARATELDRWILTLLAAGVEPVVADMGEVTDPARRGAASYAMHRRWHVLRNRPAAEGACAFCDAGE